MESKLRFVQDRTITMTFTDASAVADINIPFAVDRIVFKYIGTNANSAFHVNISSDLIQWNSIAVFLADRQNPVSSLNSQYVFQTPTKISGRYSFLAKLMSGLPDNTHLNTHDVTIVAQFIRDSE